MHMHMHTRMHMHMPTYGTQVPDECQFLRDKIADPTSVRRPKRLKIIIIKNRKHPCHGEGGLYAGEGTVRRLQCTNAVHQCSTPKQCTNAAHHAL